MMWRAQEMKEEREELKNVKLTSLGTGRYGDEREREREREREVPEKSDGLALGCVYAVCTE